jgi:hypothetical protein
LKIEERAMISFFIWLDLMSFNFALVAVVGKIHTFKERIQWWNSCKDFGFIHDEAAFCCVHTCTPAVGVWRNTKLDELQCTASDLCWLPPNFKWRRMIEGTHRWRERIQEDNTNPHYLNSSSRVIYSNRAGGKSVLKEADSSRRVHFASSTNSSGGLVEGGTKVPALSFSTYILAKSNSSAKTGMLRVEARAEKPEIKIKPDSGNANAIDKADHGKPGRTAGQLNASTGSGDVVSTEASYTGSAPKDVVNKGSVLKPCIKQRKCIASGEQIGMAILLGMLTIGILVICVVVACAPDTTPASVDMALSSVSGQRLIAVVRTCPTTALHLPRPATTSAEVARLGRVAHL